MEEGAFHREEYFYSRISELWSDFHAGNFPEETLPAYLDNMRLASLIADHSNTVVQILDMKKFKSIYVSANIETITGYTPEEINQRGIWQWLRNLSSKELFFQVRNAQIVHRQLKMTGELQPFLLSFLINSGMKTKDKKKLRILSTNFTLDWDAKGRQQHQLFLWKDATHLFKTDQVYVRHVFGRQQPVIWTYNAEREKFLNDDLLSTREKEILLLVAAGKTSKEIGSELGISSLTVDNHRKNMISRFQVRTADNLLEVAQWMKLL